MRDVEEPSVRVTAKEANPESLHAVIGACDIWENPWRWHKSSGCQGQRARGTGPPWSPRAMSLL